MEISDNQRRYIDKFIKNIDSLLEPDEQEVDDKGEFLEDIETQQDTGVVIIYLPTTGRFSMHTMHELIDEIGKYLGKDD